MNVTVPLPVQVRSATAHLLSYLARARRWPLTAALVGGLLVSTLAVPVQVGAAEYPPNKPAARLQVVVKNVKIHDDREGIFSGDGEMLLWVGIWRCKNPALPTCESASPAGVPEALPNSVANMAEPLARTGIFIYAGTGDTVTLGNVIPGGGEIWGVGTSADLGFPVYPGQHYVMQFDMSEDDDDVFTNGEYMGFIYQNITLDDLALGTHTVRSLKEDGSGPGDYTVTYEVRMAPAADLRPGSMTIEPVAGSNKSRVCIAVINSGTVASDSMYVAVKIDGTVPTGGRVDAATLGAGENGVSCVDVVLPTVGPHTLTAVVDSASTVNEYNELNNELEQTYEIGLAAGPEPTPTKTTTAPPPTASSVDLAVTTIKVNGQKPDGKADCKDGKSDIVVAVKNGGMAFASKVAVQLAVDGDKVGTETIATLAPGDTTEVRFEDVRLKKGQHTLTAALQTRSDGAETTTDSNALKVTVTCKSDN